MASSAPPIISMDAQQIDSLLTSLVKCASQAHSSLSTPSKGTLTDYFHRFFLQREYEAKLQEKKHLMYRTIRELKTNNFLLKKQNDLLQEIIQLLKIQSSNSLFYRKCQEELQIRREMRKELEGLYSSSRRERDAFFNSLEERHEKIAEGYKNIKRQQENIKKQQENIKEKHKNLIKRMAELKEKAEEFDEFEEIEERALSLQKKCRELAELCRRVSRVDTHSMDLPNSQIDAPTSLIDLEKPKIKISSLISIFKVMIRSILLYGLNAASKNLYWQRLRHSWKTKGIKLLNFPKENSWFTLGKIQAVWIKASPFVVLGTTLLVGHMIIQHR